MSCPYQVAILTAVFALGTSLSVEPSSFYFINDCPFEEGGGGGGVTKQQLSDKLKNLIIKHPREKQTYSKQHENDLLKSSKRLWPSYAYGQEKITRRLNLQ